MKAQLFLPEVRRNRLVSNWVRARALPSSSSFPMSSRRKNARAVTLAVFVLLGCFATAIAALGWESGPMRLDQGTTTQTPQSRTAASPEPVRQINQTPCDVEDSFLGLNADTPSRLDSPSFAGFDKIVSHLLGGVAVADYRCSRSSEKPLFRVRWELSNNLWKVKEISRPPEGKSGDL